MTDKAAGAASTFEPLAQNFLRVGGTLEQLTERYAIKSRRHLTQPHLVLLKYDQINSPMQEQIVRESRGLILDEAQNWNIVARAFDKFFNHGEQLAATIDWHTAKVQEKVDGSLCTLYHHDGAWHVATTGTPDASGPVHAGTGTYAELFWRVFKALGLTLPEAATNKAFLFELTSPQNRIVVQQKEDKLTLLGIRRRDGKWHDPEGWADRYPVVKSYPLNSFEQVLDSFASIDPLSHEGYVVVDASFNRVKVKHPGYVALHHLRGEGIPTPKRALEVVLAGETTEVLTAFPEFAELITDAETRLRSVGAELDAEFERIRAIPIQKDFAFEAIRTRCSAALFQRRQGRIATSEQFLRTMQIDKLLDLLGYKPVPLAEAA